MLDEEEQRVSDLVTYCEIQVKKLLDLKNEEKQIIADLKLEESHAKAKKL